MTGTAEDQAARPAPPPPKEPATWPRRPSATRPVPLSKERSRTTGYQFRFRNIQTMMIYNIPTQIN